MRIYSVLLPVATAIVVAGKIVFDSLGGSIAAVAYMLIGVLLSPFRLLSPRRRMVRRARRKARAFSNSASWAHQSAPRMPSLAEIEHQISMTGCEEIQKIIAAHGSQSPTYIDESGNSLNLGEVTSRLQAGKPVYHLAGARA